MMQQETQIDRPRIKFGRPKARAERSAFNMRIPRDAHEALQQLAEADNTSMSQLILRLIAEESERRGVPPIWAYDE